MAASLTVDNTRQPEGPVITCGRPNQPTWSHSCPPGAALTLYGEGSVFAAMVTGHGFAPYALDWEGEKQPPAAEPAS